MIREINLSAFDDFIQLQQTTIHEQPFSDSLDHEHFYANRSADRSLPFPSVLAAGEISYAIPTLLREVCPPFYTMLFCLENSAVLSLASGEYPLHRNSFLLLAPGQDLSLRTESLPFRFYIAFLSGDILSSYLNELCTGSDPSYCYREAGPEFVGYYFSQILLHLKASSDRSTNLPLSKCLLDIVCYIADAQAADMDTRSFPDYICSLKAILEEEYAFPHTLEHLSERLGINKFRLTREFSRLMGISPMQYLSQIRLEQSKQLLVHTDLTVHAVGSCVGIPNTTHFINLFRRQTGLTPLQYRKLHAH